MDIWLSGNIKAHPFVPEAYWRSNFLFVKEAILKSEVYVAESDNAVVGFIGLQDDFISGLFIDRNFRSQGIGKQLLDKAKQQSRHLSLLVYADNIRAFAFYERERLCRCTTQLDEETNNYEFLMVWPDTATPNETV